jgi:tRNA-dihydrouridine synthase B
LLARLVAEMPLPIVGNGDIRLWSDYRLRMEEARPAGIMIGREAARRPWIFALLRGKEKSPDFAMDVDLRATAFRMLDLIQARLIEEFWLTRAQRFFSYYADNFTYAHHIKWKLVNAPGLDAMRRELDAYFEDVPSDRIRRDVG